jgi:polyhydroxyalkanoate synthesis regulator phasin
MIKRKKQFYYQTDFAVDEFSMRSLKVLQLKFSRDYLKFFKTLQSVYGPRQRAKTEINEAIIAVEKVCGMLDGILTSGNITKEDAKEIYDLVEAVEEKKQRFLENVKATKSLQNIMESTSGQIGITPEDLNVTKSLVKKFVSPAVKRAKEGTLEYLQRRYPNLYGTGSDLAKGFGAALLGPMYPLAKTLYHGARELPGMSRTISSRFGAGSSIGSIFAPISDRRSGDSDRRGFGLGFDETTKTSGKRAGKEIGVETLKEFYNKDAYRARYTKEMLNVLKRNNKESQKGGFLDSILSPLSNGFGKLLEIIGAGGLLGALGKDGLLGAVEALALRLGTIALPVAAGTGIGALLYGLLKKWSDAFEAFIGPKFTPIPSGESMGTPGVSATVQVRKGVYDPESPPYTPGKPLLGGKTDSQRIDDFIHNYFKENNLPLSSSISNKSPSGPAVVPSLAPRKEGIIDDLFTRIQEEKTAQEQKDKESLNNVGKDLQTSLGNFTKTLQREMEKARQPIPVPPGVHVNQHMSGDVLMQQSANGNLRSDK